MYGVFGSGEGEGTNLNLPFPAGTAGDTFRAAAVEQLQAWGERNNVPVIAQGQDADPASVAFDGLQAAKSRGTDVLIGGNGNNTFLFNTNLSSSDILSLTEDKFGNLWCSSVKGISLINYNSPFSYFDEKTGLIGDVNTIAKGGMYIGTTEGIFKKNEKLSDDGKFSNRSLLLRRLSCDGKFENI